MLVVIRVSLPDRPGALGQVASRIGSVRGDLLAIDILESNAGRAVDEFVVAVDEERLLDLMINEVNAVDGVTVEDVRIVDDDRRAPEFVVLEAAIELAEAGPIEALEVLCRSMIDVVGADWCVVGRGGEILERIGELPVDLLDEPSGAGSAGLDPGDRVDIGLPGIGVTVTVGRVGRRIHDRERMRAVLLGRIADAVIPPPVG